MPDLLALAAAGRLPGGHLAPWAEAIFLPAPTPSKLKKPPNSAPEELEGVNAEWMDTFLPAQEVMDIRADGDAHLDIRSFKGFVVPPCSCGGVWKPRVVFFGGSIESSVKLEAQNLLQRAAALLVMGTSAKVYSAFSLIRLAADGGKPVAVVNIGETRADALIAPELRMHLRCSEALAALCRQLGLQV